MEEDVGDNLERYNTMDQLFVAGDATSPNNRRVRAAEQGSSLLTPPPTWLDNNFSIQVVKHTTIFA